MITLVQGMEAQDGGGGGGSCNGARPVPKKCRQVISGGLHGAFANVPALGGDIIVKISAEELQLGVVDAAPRVIEGDQVLGYVRRERNTPDNRNGL